MRILPVLLLLTLALPLRALAVTTHGVPDLATEQQHWWGDMGQGYVVGGCLPTLGPAAALPVPACRGYGRLSDGRLHYFWEEHPRTLALPPTDGRYWLAAQATVADVLPGWTRLAGTHYLWRLEGDPTTRPLPPVGGLLLASLTVASAQVTAVGDYRPDSPLKGQPLLVTSPVYGVTGDCVTDDTAGIQQAINAAAWQDRPLHIPKPPGGCYKFTRLWLDHQSTANPGFPSVGVEQGNLRITCDGQSTTASTVTGPRMDTFLVSTDATGPALNADKGGQVGNPLRNIQLEGCSIEAGNTTRVVDIRGLNSMARLQDLYIVQTNNAGGGVLLQDVTLIEFFNSFLFHASNSAVPGASGAGLIIRNETSSGGGVVLDNITARGWGAPGGTCIILGHTDLTVGKLINNITGRLVQGIGCDINLRIAGGAVAGTLEAPHIEGAKTTGLWMSHGARNWVISGAYFENPAATLADLRLGNAGAPGAEDATSGLTLLSPTFNSLNQIGILRESTLRTTRTLIINPAFVAQTSGQGIGIDCSPTPGGILHSVIILGLGATELPPVNIAQVTRNCEKASIVEEPNYVRLGNGVAIGATTAPQIQAVYHGTQTLDFPSISPGVCSELALAVPGLPASSLVFGQVQDAAVMAGVQYTFRASGTTAGEARVRACNLGAGAQDPPPATFQVLGWDLEPEPALEQAPLPPAQLPTPGAGPTLWSAALLLVPLLGWVADWALGVVVVLGWWCLGYLLVEWRPLRRSLWWIARRLYGRSLEE